jgi:nucleoside-diphosphate-sugar epimerase
MSQPGRVVLLTGGTGYLGGVLAAGLLRDPTSRLILPVRSQHTPESVLNHIAAELFDEAPPGWQERVRVLPLPPANDIPALAPGLRRMKIDSIVHSAGCVDYFHKENLSAGNIELTRALVNLGQELNVGRFAFVSTAFSSGYYDGLIPESLHDDPDEDPTDYTRTKRAAERIVAASGLPYLIVRPSVVIGDSRTGRYRGKRYGIYQLWTACEKIMCTEYIPEIYAIAPDTPLPLLHQDAFCSSFLTALRTLPANRIVHLVSTEDMLPTVRALWDAWLMACNRPRTIHYYKRLADVPMERLNRRQQMWVELTGVNLDISTRPWHFDRRTLDGLIAEGTAFAEVTHRTIANCQDRFIADSPRVQQFIKRYSAERAIEPTIVEHW